MEKLNKVVKVISKVCEVGYFIGAAMSVVLAIWSITGRVDMLKNLSSYTPETTTLSSLGFSVGVVDAAGNPVSGALAVFFIVLVFTLSAMAMIFRNINLIFKTTKGETWFSKGETPFQPDNIRMVREIGIFLISIPVVELIGSTIGKIAIGVGLFETSVDFSFVMIGLVVLCLSQYFAYGMELQNDVDGLV